MKRVAFLLLLLLIALLTVFRTLPDQVFSQEDVRPFFSPTPYQELDYVLPYPGILPDHRLYFLKKLRDSILLFLTRDPVRKSELYLLMADKKVGMGQLLWEKGKPVLTIDTFKEAEKDLLSAAFKVVKLKDLGKLPEGFADKVELAAKKHNEIISRVETSQVAYDYQNQLKEALEINQQAIGQLATVK